MEDGEVEYLTDTKVFMVVTVGYVLITRPPLLAPSFLIVAAFRDLWRGRLILTHESQQF